MTGATAYDRIAGYFSSSILEVAGEALDAMAPGAVVRVVCNSDARPARRPTARAAKQAMTREWMAQPCRTTSARAWRARLERLTGFLDQRPAAGRVLPDERLRPDPRQGRASSPAGTVARSPSWAAPTSPAAPGSSNYELVWTDDSPEGVAWVQDEFDALWTHPDAIDLADARRPGRRAPRPPRSSSRTSPAWKTRPTASRAAAAVELPIYRRENGLWAHQKWFVHHAFELHKRAAPGSCSPTRSASARRSSSPWPPS